MRNWRQPSDRPVADPTEPTSDVSEPDDVWIDTGPDRLHALLWDSDSDSTIVFVHGGRLTAHSWRRICAQLRDSYRCVAVELRGHGDSTWSSMGRYGLADYAADIGRVVDHLGLASFTLVGGSLGGLAAMTYAIAHVDVVASFVAVDVSPCGPMSPGVAEIARFGAETASLSTLEEFVDHAARFNPRRSRSELARALERNLRQRSDGGWTWKYDPVQFEPPVFEARQAERHRLCERLGSLRCPTLLIRGAESDILSAAEAEELHVAIPECTLVTIAGAGHNVHGDRPDDLVHVIRDFLVSVTPA